MKTKTKANTKTKTKKLKSTTNGNKNNTNTKFVAVGNYTKQQKFANKLRKYHSMYIDITENKVAYSAFENFWMDKVFDSIIKEVLSPPNI